MTTAQEYNNTYREWLKDIPSEAHRHGNVICYCLAHVLASKAEKEGFETYKVCAMSSKREGEFSPDVSVFLKNAETNQFDKIDYDYHMAAAIKAKVDGKDTMLVMDPILFGDNLVTLKQWQNTLACPEYDLLLAPNGQKLGASPKGYNVTSADPENKDADSWGKINAVAENIRHNQELLASGQKGYTPKTYLPLTSLLMRSSSATTVFNAPKAGVVR